MKLTKDTEKNNKVDWSLDKKLSWGHVMTTVGLLLAAFTYGADLDKRVALMENDVARLERMEVDIRDIRDTVILLKPYMRRKDEVDKSQWEKINAIGKR